MMTTTLFSIFPEVKKVSYIHSQVLMNVKVGHANASITRLAGGTRKLSAAVIRSISYENEREDDNEIR